MSIFFFLWMNLALAALTIGLVQRLPSTWSGAHKLTAASVFLVFIPVIVLILVNLIAPVTALTAAIAVTLLLAAERWVARPARPTTETTEAVVRDWPDGLGVASLGAVVGFWAGATLLGGTDYAWDDLTYHAASPGWWMQSASLDVAPFTYQAYYPLNAEVLSLWFMLPFAHDVHVNVGVFLWMALAASSALAIASSLGQNRAGAMCWAAVFLGAPPVRVLAHSFTPTDVAVGALAMAALAFALVGDETKGRERQAAAVMSGLAIGAALGTKVIVASTAGLLLIWWVVAAFKSERTRHWWRPVALFVVCAAFAGGWWYLRNLVLYANPLFPAEFGPLGGPFDNEAQRDTSMIPFLTEGWASLEFWTRLLWLRWDWPLLAGVVSLVGALVAVIRPPGPHKNRLRFAGLVMIAILLTFPIMPFSGTGNRPVSGLHSYLRYLCYPFGLGLVLAGSLLPRERDRAPLYVGVPVALLLYELSEVSLPEIGALMIGLSVSLTLWLVATDPQVASLRRPVLPWAGAAVVVVLLALHTPLQRARADSNLLAFGATVQHPDLESREAWRILEQLPEGATLGGYSYLPNDSRFFYPQFGRSYRLRPVAVAEDGMLLPPLHERWETQPPGWWTQFRTKTELDGDTFVANLQMSKVDFVIVTMCEGGFVWPRQREWLMEATTVDLVHGDWCSEIWDIRQGAEPIVLQGLDLNGKAVKKKGKAKPHRMKKRKPKKK